MNKYCVLTADGQTVKVLAQSLIIRDGALCFYALGGVKPEERLVVSYAAGCWKFLGLLDGSGDVPNIEE